MGMELEREDEEEELNTYQRVYAINNEAGPPLIRPLPILTNNLGERRRGTLVKMPLEKNPPNLAKHSLERQSPLCTYAVPIVPAIPIS